MTHIKRGLSVIAVLLLLGACGDNLSISGLSIEGVVWDDANGNGLLDADDTPLADVSVYLDADDNRVLDEGEVSVRTDGAGRFSFAGLSQGSYIVRQDLPFGWRSSTGVSARATRSTTAKPTSDPGVAHIIGGADASETAYPFMASVGSVFDGDYFHTCGGALISDRFVLTAAHCSEGSEPDEVMVMLGTNNPDVGGHLVSVKSITLHPEWGERISDGYDMALWELGERLNLTELELHTVDMLTPETRDLAAPTRLSTTIGWGVSDNSSPLLQQVHIPIASEETCATSYPQVATFETQICAGAIAGGLDSCQGDSGGPLLVRDDAGRRWMHAGITSWGEGCALAGKPGLYGRTSEMSTWAMGRVREESRGYIVKLSTRKVQLEFPNQATIRPLIGDLPPRWALSRLTLSGVEEGSIDADTPFVARFFLFGESFGSRQEFDCEVDMDGPGSIEAIGNACQAGTNKFILSGYPDGAYQLTLSATSGGKTRAREELIVAGTLEVSEVQGALAISDDSDADYPGIYYIDYYEVSGAQVGVLSLVEADASFGLQLGLYDADVRTAAEGGGIFAVDSSGDPVSLKFVPEEGKRYLLGVSSQGSKATGSYTLRLRNNGTPTPTNLP